MALRIQDYIRRDYEKLALKFLLQWPCEGCIQLPYLKAQTIRNTCKM